MIDFMDLLDVGIIIFLLADIVRGARVGLSRQVFSFAGFWGGLFLAALLAPEAAKLGHTTLAKGIAILAVALAVAVGLSSLGEYIGIVLSREVRKLHIGPLDASLGAVFGALLVGLTVWLVAAMSLNLPQRTISQEVQQSFFVHKIDAVLPAAPPLIARIQRLIDPNGFPDVFLGPEPAAGSVNGVASTPEETAAINAAGASTVKIEGFGCGEEISGSGFVVAPGIVVTNAHVVAGVDHPLVIDRNGVHTAVAISFDPNLDLAVLRTSNLAGPALSIDSDYVANGTHSVVLGYPGGGPFTASAGAVIQHYVATGRNIYDEGITARQIYEIQAVVQPGNSGGPLVTPDGLVVGVVFARSEVNNNVGYALTSGSILNELHQAEARNTTTSTGACAAE